MTDDKTETQEIEGAETIRERVIVEGIEGIERLIDQHGADNLEIVKAYYRTPEAEQALHGVKQIEVLVGPKPDAPPPPPDQWMIGFGKTEDGLPMLEWDGRKWVTWGDCDRVYTDPNAFERAKSEAKRAASKMVRAVPVRED